MCILISYIMGKINHQEIFSTCALERYFNSKMDPKTRIRLWISLKEAEAREKVSFNETFLSALQEVKKN